jgi:signal transduction histidine kinase
MSLSLVGQRFRESHIRVLRRNGQVLPDVVADSELLKQVFINLLTNAADAMQEGGEIQIEAVPDRQEDGVPFVAVRFQDQGPGVPEEVRGQIFQPFVTTKATGMGLGLSIAAEIMTLHGGGIVLESSTPQGSCFTVRIPTSEE